MEQHRQVADHPLDHHPRRVVSASTLPSIEK